MAKKLPEQDCAYCGKTYTPLRRWQKFCGSQCRGYAFEDKEASQKVHNLKLCEKACYYCGVIADTIDHVPPTSIRPTLVSLGLHLKIPFKEVRACRECNSLLGSRDIWLLTQRKQFIKKALRRRYKKILKCPEWTDSELASLNGSLQSFVIQRQVLKEILFKRLAW